jgi:DNA-binding CsgD family transcriptional regulator
MTRTNLKLCAYLRLNLSSKEIASLLNITVSGIDKARNRLRKKLNLEPNVDLYDFLLKF